MPAAFAAEPFVEHDLRDTDDPLPILRRAGVWAQAPSAGPWRAAFIPPAADIGQLWRAHTQRAWQKSLRLEWLGVMGSDARKKFPHGQKIMAKDRHHLPNGVYW